MSDEFAFDQECYVVIPRLGGIDRASRLASNHSRRVASEEDDSDGYFEPIPRVSKSSSSKMSRVARKRTSGGDVPEEPQVHVNKAKGGPLSKKVKFNVQYDPEKDNLSFTPLDSEKYALVSTIIPPTYSDAVCDCVLFPLNKSQSKKLNFNNYCVLLRLSYFNKQDGNFDDIFDYGMHIKINDVNLPLTVPTEDDPHAPLDGPADITRYLIAEGNSIEKIKISFEGQAKPHIFSVLFCKKKKDELPFVSLRYSEPNQTFKLVMLNNEKAKPDDKSVFRKIYTLLDPESKQRIDVPVRGQYCTHVECFDKRAFLRAHRRKVGWSCPICFKPIKEDQLVVDGLFLIILAQTYTSCTSVELNSVGNWCPIYRDKIFRVRTVDLENDVSEGEDDEEEQTGEKSPEGPLSPVDIPPEPEEPEIEPVLQNGDTSKDDLVAAREAETQTPSNSDFFEIDKSHVNLEAEMDGPPDYPEDSLYDNDTNEGTPSVGATDSRYPQEFPKTVINQHEITELGEESR